jgi:hypothetical protein
LSIEIEIWYLHGYKEGWCKGVANKIQSVFGGAMEYMDAASLGQDLSDLKYIEDTLMEGTRRLQVKSHITDHCW